MPGLRYHSTGQTELAVQPGACRIIVAIQLTTQVPRCQVRSAIKQAFHTALVFKHSRRPEQRIVLHASYRLSTVPDVYRLLTLSWQHDAPTGINAVGRQNRTAQRMPGNYIGRGLNSPQASVPAFNQTTCGIERRAVNTDLRLIGSVQAKECSRTDRHPTRVRHLQGGRIAM